MKFYEHPSYSGYANELTKDSRMEEWEKDYNERGFDDTVTWSLDDTLIKWLTPRLERFLEISEQITDADEFHNDVREMLYGFKLYTSTDFSEFNEEHIKKLNKSFELLAKNYRGLWW